MDVVLFQKTLSAVSILISLGVLFYAWFTARSKVNEEHLKSVDLILDDHKTRIQEMEGELKHLPGKDDVTDLKLTISELKGVVGRMDESMKNVQRGMNNVTEFLLKEKK
ncbi:MAG: DUF2730 family protein [Rhizobiaceae bacterium]